MGAGLLKTKGTLVNVGLARVRATAFFGRLTATCRVAFAGFLDLASAFALFRFAEVAGGLGLGLAARIGLAVRTGLAARICLAVRTFDAFLARAFPAGERLVAGLRRVDLPATTRLRDDATAAEWREEERDASFFRLLAMGLLMRKALDSKTIHQKDRRKKQRESLT